MSATDRSASELEREVETSRANLEDTVEALKDKMSVSQMVDEASRYFGHSSGGELLGRLGEQARANPLPLALIGVGLAWLMSGRGQPHLSGRGDRSYDRWADRDDYEALGDEEYRRAFGESAVYAGASHSDYASPSMGAGDHWSDAGWREGQRRRSGGRVRGAAHAVGETASSVASGVGSAVGGVASAVGSVASGVAGAVGTVAGAVGSAAGAVGSAAAGLGHVASSAGRSAYSAAGSAADVASSGAEAAWRSGAGAYRGASRAGSGAYRGASHLGSGAYSGASRLGSDARRTFSEVLESEPLIIGALGVAVGAAIGALLPGTETEDRYLGETRDRLRDDAEALAREKFAQGKDLAAEAYRTAKEEAEAQGLTTTGEDSLADRLGQAARNTVERVRESAAEKGFAGETGAFTESAETSYSDSTADDAAANARTNRSKIA